MPCVRGRFRSVPEAPFWGHFARFPWHFGVSPDCVEFSGFDGRIRNTVAEGNMNEKNVKGGSGYEAAPATRMLASNCICCGRALVDATSVQLGIGPECRQGFDGGIADGVRKEANELVYRAAIAAQQGEISGVLEYANKIRALGLDVLADKVARRFRNAERYTEIVITVDGGDYRVETPFRRGKKDEFIAAWRSIPGRRYRDEANYIPIAQGKALYGVLKQFFGGKVAKGPKGLFKIPEPALVPKQDELNLTA